MLPDGAVEADLDEARIRRSILILADCFAMVHRDASMSVALTTSEAHLAIEIAVDTDEPFSFDGLPTASEVLAADDAGTIRQWPVAVTSELVASHGGSLYHGAQPLRFLLRLPLGEIT
jgi:hypothetical protein